MNSETCLVPSTRDICADPELVTLATLDLVLAATRNSLQAHVPEVSDPWGEDEPPGPEALVAELILWQVAHLRRLIEHYRRFNKARYECRRGWRPSDDDIF
jgi:hypothetical protein